MAWNLRTGLHLGAGPLHPPPALAVLCCDLGIVEQGKHRCYWLPAPLFCPRAQVPQTSPLVPGPKEAGQPGTAILFTQYLASLWSRHITSPSCPPHPLPYECQSLNWKRRERRQGWAQDSVPWSLTLWVALGGIMAKVKVAGFSWASWGLPHLKSCWASPRLGSSNPEGPQPRWSQFGRGNRGEGQHRGQYDWVPWGPLGGMGTSCRGRGLRTVSRLAEGWAVATSFISSLAGAQGGCRGPARGHSLKEGGGGKGLLIPGWCKKLQEEGEDIDDV